MLAYLIVDFNRYISKSDTSERVSTFKCKTH